MNQPLAYRTAIARGTRISISRLWLPLWVVLAAPATGFGMQTVLEIAPEFRRWTFERPRIDHEVEQSYVAADLGFHFDSGLHLAAGANFVSTVHHEEEVTGNIDGLGELRFRAEHRFVSDRLRIGARAAFPLSGDEFLPREIRALRMLEIPQLEFPLADAGVGGHQGIDLTGQIVRQRSLLAQIGLGVEARNSYAIRDDGLELDPGGLIRVGGSVDHSLSSWVLHHGAVLERPSTTTLDGRDAFRNGTRITWDEGLSLLRSENAWRADLALLLAQSGKLFPGGTLVEDPLRSGNRVRWRVAHDRESSWPLRVALTGTHYRGFSGTLGHADWVTPSLRVGHRFGPGVLEGTFDLSVGTVREGGSLGGVGVRLAWRGGLE